MTATAAYSATHCPAGDFLRLGTAGLLGSQFALPAVAAGRKRRRPRRRRRNVSLIFLFLHGGLSTIDTWDLKPDAPAEFRGEFQPIATNVPGIQIGEHLPQLGPANGQVLADPLVPPSQFRPRAGRPLHADRLFPAGRLQPGAQPEQPAAGARLDHRPQARAARRRAAVRLPAEDAPQRRARPTSAPPRRPFVIEADPNAPDFSVPDIVPPPALARQPPGRAPRAAAPGRPLSASRPRRGANRHAQRGRASSSDKAFDLMTSPAAKRRLRHPRRARHAARRVRPQLAGPVVPDGPAPGRGGRALRHHRPQQLGHARQQLHHAEDTTCCRVLDAALSTLFRDLADRGLLESTLVVVTGEFGRTPRINKNAGRDHWGPGVHRGLGRRRHPGRPRHRQLGRPGREAGRRPATARKTWRPRSITCWASTPTTSSTRPKAGP